MFVDDVTAPCHQSNGTNRTRSEKEESLRVGTWMDEGGRNARKTSPTREVIVPCRSASHAGRKRVWGSHGERGQKFGSCWVDQPSQEVVLFLSIRIPTPKFSFDRGRRGWKELVCFLRLSYVDRRSRMVLYHSEAWSSEQLQPGIVRDPAGITVWCHSMVP